MPAPPRRRGRGGVGLAEGVRCGYEGIGASSGVNSSPASPKEHSVDVDDTVKPDAAASDGGTQTDDSNNVAAVHGEEAVPARA